MREINIKNKETISKNFKFLFNKETNGKVIVMGKTSSRYSNDITLTIVQNLLLDENNKILVISDNLFLSNTLLSWTDKELFQPDRFNIINSCNLKNIYFNINEYTHIILNTLNENLLEILKLIVKIKELGITVLLQVFYKFTKQEVELNGFKYPQKIKEIADLIFVLLQPDIEKNEIYTLHKII